MERMELAPGYSISRIIKGNWHLAGGHGRVDEGRALEDMRDFVVAGITTFDCADIYTGVEELTGKFLRRERDAFRSGNLEQVQLHTKYVPDYEVLSSLTRRDTEVIIDRSLRRLGVERLDLVQFSWWDYRIPGYVETAVHLQELQQKGKIRHIGATNFDTLRMQEILAAGVPIIAHQVQYSVLDHRPERGMQQLALDCGFSLLCYGVLAGGFLGSRLAGLPLPFGEQENRSLTKYRLIIEEFGGEKAFQSLLLCLLEIAKRHGIGIPEVAARYILQKPGVGAIILGAPNRNHLEAMASIWPFQLHSEEMEAIHQLASAAAGPAGDVYALERDKDGPHGSIMRYNLNGQAALRL